MLPIEKRLPAQAGHIPLPLSASASLPVSEREFKDSMARLAFSIAIVTARYGSEEIGRTVTSFMPMSALPPRVLISIDVRSRLIDLIGATGTFSLSFLASDQEDVGDAFAGKLRQADRFGIGEWDCWPSGNRKLVDAVMSIDCELTASIDAGDHMLFVGTIVETETSSRSNLLLWNERGYLRAAGPSASNSHQGDD